jgi:hypothetical protein
VHLFRFTIEIYHNAPPYNHSREHKVLPSPVPYTFTWKIWSDFNNTCKYHTPNFLPLALLEFNSKLSLRKLPPVRRTESVTKEPTTDFMILYSGCPPSHWPFVGHGCSTNQPAAFPVIRTIFHSLRLGKHPIQYTFQVADKYEYYPVIVGTFRTVQ